MAPPRRPRLRGSVRRVLDSPVELIEVSDDEDDVVEADDLPSPAAGATSEADAGGRCEAEASVPGIQEVVEEVTSSTRVDVEASPSSLSSSSGASPTSAVPVASSAPTPAADLAVAEDLVWRPSLDFCRGPVCLG